MAEDERWQCIGQTRDGEACRRVVPFSVQRLELGLQPLCHQHFKEVEEGLQREYIGAAAPSMSHGLRSCAAVRRFTGDVAVRCGRPAPSLSLRGSAQLALAQRICDEHRRELAKALIKQWEEQEPHAAAHRWGAHLHGIRPG